ncbi:unnamed protein product [Schistocephalus solidus]|uniref:Secreted protein n=1 Tax=Schistocephalus solidus TaxID=70667 RepID=A0A183SEX1_SCHSO|nr:unnamed protein product [Schistocephalus solidus]
MLLWSPLTGTQLSSAVPRSWALLRGHNPRYRHDQPTKRGESIRRCFCLHIRLPTLTPGINYVTPTIIDNTSQYSSPVTSTSPPPPLPPSPMGTLS